MFLRRVGPPRENGNCPGFLNCPDILELDSGDFAVIGEDITSSEVKEQLPAEAGCAEHETIVKVPRSVFLAAKPYLPDA